jgi:tetratricopeptide (TPR) repeat protein
MNKEELIQDYIANRLSAEEKARVATLLATDVELQELLALHQDMAEAFAISNKKALKKHFQDLEAKSTSETTVTEAKNNSGILRRFAIAAILIVGVFFAINQFTRNDVFDSYFEVCPNTYLPVTRGITNENLEFEAFKAYESGDFEKASTIFSEVLTKTKNSNLQFYHAMSLLNQQQYDSALAKLKVLTQESFEYQAEALWYAALVAIKNENSATAKNYLQQLQKVNPNYKTEAVTEILKELH